VPHVAETVAPSTSDELLAGVPERRAGRGSAGWSTCFRGRRGCQRMHLARSSGRSQSLLLSG